MKFKSTLLSAALLCALAGGASAQTVRIANRAMPCRWTRTRSTSRCS